MQNPDTTTPVTTEGTPQAGTMFTGEAVQEMIQTALRELSVSHQAELDLIRQEAVRRVSAATGTPNSTNPVNAYVAETVARETIDAQDRQVLSKIFGAGSDAKAASDLGKKDMAQYRKLRERAIQLGLLDGPNADHTRPLDRPVIQGFRKR